MTAPRNKKRGVEASHLDAIPIYFPLSWQYLLKIRPQFCMSRKDFQLAFRYLGITETIPKGARVLPYLIRMESTLRDVQGMIEVSR